MKFIWNAKYTGANECSGTLMGDPVVNLLCNRETGAFTPDLNQEGAPDGWLIGELLTTTQGKGRILKARVIARIGGQWDWSGGFNTPGTRHVDFAQWAGNYVEIEAEKPSAQSWFAKQLVKHGWEVTDAVSS